MGLAINGGHGYENWYERFGKTHPEYFAVQPCGKRDLERPRHPDRLKLCDSEPSVVEQIAADINEALKKNPNLQSWPVAPNDDGWWGHCMCDRCKSWDNPRGEKMTYTDTVTGKQFEHVSLSDRMARFYDTVARRVSREHPNLLLIGHAYCAYDPAPLRATIHPNVVIQYSGSCPYLAKAWHEKDMANLAGWARTGARVFWRPNWLPAGLGLPFDFSHRFARDMRRLVKHLHLLGTDFDTQYHYWGGQGLSYFVMARVMWDANQNIEALTADYVRSGFGKAAPAVAAYFRRVRRLSDEHYAHWNVNANWFKGGPAFYDEKFFADARRCLEKAARLAESDTAEVQKRVQFLAENLEWSGLEAEIVQRASKYQRGDKSQHDPLIDLERRRLRWYADHKLTWTIYVPSLRYFEDRYRCDMIPIPENELGALHQAQPTR
jgi:hypothetical protein